MAVTVGAATAGTLMAALAVTYYSKDHKKAQKKFKKMSKLDAKLQTWLQTKEVDELVKAAEAIKTQKRNVHLYFNQNDEMTIRDDQDPSVDPSFKQRIVVNLGDEEYDRGVKNISQNLF